MWKRRPRLVESSEPAINRGTIAEQLVFLNHCIEDLIASGQPVNGEREAIAAAEECLKRFAAEMGFPAVEFCALPGCGKPFIKSVPHQRFHTSQCKQTFDNKHRVTPTEGATQGATT